MKFNILQTTSFRGDCHEKGYHSPKEYERFLAEYFPHSQEDLETLTETLMLARYSA